MVMVKNVSRLLQISPANEACFSNVPHRFDDEFLAWVYQPMQDIEEDYWLVSVDQEVVIGVVVS